MGRRYVVAFLAAPALALVLALFVPASTPRAEACAFLRTPATYEADQSRLAYLAALDAASVNQLFPGNPYFGLPAIERGVRGGRVPGDARIPQTLLKSIAWIESTMTMAQRSVPFEATGPALVSFDCGHGVMQVTTGMTIPLGSGERATANQVAVATHYSYNIARGAAILAEKWNDAPDLRPVVGTDTGSDPAIIENWYFAAWGYNGFTGPGANRSNHPLDPAFGAFPRQTFSCEGNQSRTRYPYQELVWGCMQTPPVRNGQQLWAPVAASLPNTTQPQWFEPLSLARFAFPYSRMDMPTPLPAHPEGLPALRGDLVQMPLGAPTLQVDQDLLRLSAQGRPEDARATLRITNGGSGLLPWAAISDDRWLVVDTPAGAALGSNVPCRQDCGASSAITVSVNPTLLPSASAIGTLRITTPTGAERVVRVEVDAAFEVGAPGVSRAQ